MAKLPFLASAALAALPSSAPAQAQSARTASAWVPPARLLTTEGCVARLKEFEAAPDERVKFNILPQAPMVPPQAYAGNLAVPDAARALMRRLP